MAIRGFIESSLATSEIWAGKDGMSGINNVGNEKMVDKAINLIKNAKHLTNEDIEAAYISVKQVTDTLTREAVKAFDDGRVVLLYNRTPALSVTKALPFITFRTKSGYVTYVFMDNYISINRDDVMTIASPAILRDLLTGAMIANGIKRDYSNLSTNQYFHKILTEMYTKFVMRIINRQFSIAPDKVTFDVVQYWVSKFFLIKILGANDTPENIENIASSHFKYIDDLKFQEIKDQYDRENPQHLSELLELVKTASPRMKTLALGTFISSWIDYYYVPSMLAADNIEYLLFMIITLLSGTNIISIAAGDIAKEAKNIKSFRGELLKLI